MEFVEYVRAITPNDPEFMIMKLIKESLLK